MKIEYQEVTSCPLCGTKNKGGATLSIDNYRFGNELLNAPETDIEVLECSRCGLWYKNIVPTKNSLELLFNTEAGEVWKTKRLQYKDEINVIKNYLFNGDEKLIDIGSSDCGFILVIKDIVRTVSAADVYVSPECSKIINGEYLKCFIEDEEIKASYKYNIITAFDLFEHLYEPMRAMHNFNKLIDTHGVIFGETGDTDCVNDLSKWWYVKLIEHHIFWNKRAFQYLANAYDMKLDIYISSVHKGRRYMSPIKRLIAFILNSLRKVTCLRRLLLRVLSIDISMIGNPYKKDHAMFVLRK